MKHYSGFTWVFTNARQTAVYGFTDPTAIFERADKYVGYKWSYIRKEDEAQQAVDYSPNGFDNPGDLEKEQKD